MDRQQAFNKLNDQDREFLKELAGLFGKPSAIAIRFRDGSRYDGGQFVAAQDFPDFIARLAKQMIKPNQPAEDAWAR